MSVRLLGFTTLACGCVVGRYREVATSREIAYVEEKGRQCDSPGHRCNYIAADERRASGPADSWVRLPKRRPGLQPQTRPPE